MQIQLLLSIFCSDKPGLVETLSSTIESNAGNWLESRLANLRGKFVGAIWVSVAESHRETLEAQLNQLSASGIYVRIEEDLDTAPSQAGVSTIPFNAIGPDRKGIIKEISAAFHAEGINLEELQTNLSSAAYSGEPMFEACGTLSFSQSLDIDLLREKMADIQDNLGLDITINK